MKTIKILVGIPCSGKSTYSENEYNYQKKYLHKTVTIISRDKIRESIINYVHNSYCENLVTEIFKQQFQTFIKISDIIILDNTHCKEKYIDQLIKEYSEYNINIIFFDISLIKAHYRNIIRYYKTGKWIPLKIMNNMYKNYKKINKQKYAKYLVHE